MNLTEAVQRFMDAWEDCKIDPSYKNLEEFEEALEILCMEAGSAYASFEQANHEAECEIYQD